MKLLIDRLIMEYLPIILGAKGYLIFRLPRYEKMIERRFHRWQESP